MTYQDLLKVRQELNRFDERLQKLILCTQSAMNSRETKIWKDEAHYRKYKCDEGCRSSVSPSKRRASVKRGAIDLRQELLKVVK